MHPDTLGGLPQEPVGTRGGDARQRPPAGLQQVAPKTAGDSRLPESEVALIKSTSVVLRGSSENSEARPSASEPQLNTITNSPQGPRSRR